MLVKILKPGRYIGMDLKAKNCKVRDELDTPEWYAQKLIEKGKAEEIKIAPPSKKRTSAKKSTGKKPVEKKPVESTANPFLEP